MTLKDLVTAAADFYDEARKLSYTSNRTVLENLRNVHESELPRKILSLNQEIFKKEVGEAITKQLVEILRLAAMVECHYMTASCAKIEVENFHAAGLKLLSSNSWLSFSSSSESPAKKLFDDFIEKFHNHMTNCAAEIKEATQKEIERLKVDLENITQLKTQACMQAEKLAKEQKNILLPHDTIEKITHCLAIESQFITNFNALYDTEKSKADVREIYQKLSLILSDILATDSSTDAGKLESIFSDNFAEKVHASFEKQSPVAFCGGVLFTSREPQPKYQFYFYACEILKLLKQNELSTLPRNVHAHNLALCKMQAAAIREAKVCAPEKKNSEKPTPISAVDAREVMVMSR